jgi:hypothetical protein
MRQKLTVARAVQTVSMSDMKHDAIVGQGIPIHERVEIPQELIPADSMVEIGAKIAAGYYTGGQAVTTEDLEAIQGRVWKEDGSQWEDLDVSLTRNGDACLLRAPMANAIFPTALNGRITWEYDCSFSTLSAPVTRSTCEMQRV